MERTTCPFLGLPDDANTTMAYPSDGNYCHKAHPPASVNLAHQTAYCLVERHKSCPIFLARRAAALPGGLAAPLSTGARMRKTLGSPAVRAAALLVLLASAWFGTPQAAARVMSLANPPPYSGLGLPVTGPAFGVKPPEPLIDGARATNPQPGARPAKKCPVLGGWEPYVVQPTDSLFRLSVLFRAKVETLQKVNCLGSETFLAPGTILYVPIRRPTPTLTASPTRVPPTPVPPVSAPVIVPGGGDSSDDDEDPRAPAPDEKDDDEGKDENKDEDKDKNKGKDKPGKGGGGDDGDDGGDGDDDDGDDGDDDEKDDD